MHPLAKENCCTQCSLLGDCISFVMKSAEGANFKLIAPTQRPPPHHPGRSKSRNKHKMSADTRSPSSPANNRRIKAVTVGFHTFSSVLRLHTSDSWSVLCGPPTGPGLCSTTAPPNCCGLSPHQPASVWKKETMFVAGCSAFIYILSHTQGVESAWSLLQGPAAA